MAVAADSNELDLDPGNWTIPEATWLETGHLLETHCHRYGYLLVSPNFHLQGGRAYSFHWPIELLGHGGITFGLQDDAGAQWLQMSNYAGKGLHHCHLRFRSAQDGRFRLVLANCVPEAPVINRMRLFELQSSTKRSDVRGETASLRVHHLEPPACWQGPLLCVTHSQRPVDFDRCSLNALTQRYRDPGRLDKPTPFAQLTPAAAHTAWRGQLTVWGFPKQVWRQPRLLAQLEPYCFKPQHALWHKGYLWLLGGEVIEVYDSCLRQQARIEDPWLAGGHTLAASGRGTVLVACSASDAVLEIDEQSFAIVKAQRVPDGLYGTNYRLSRADSVADHFIVNDLQLTHLNSVYPYRAGCLISTLIQGLIGCFDDAGNFHEIQRGFVGCHGVRTAKDGTIYFSDSTQGNIIFLDREQRIERRLQLGSRWLHDALQLDDQTWAAALSDRNQVVFLNPVTGDPLHILDGAPFGASTQFLSFGK